MSDQESISFEPDEPTQPTEPTQPAENGPSNRPAVGAKHARPSELDSDEWNQVGQGADFLGLGGDLSSGQETPPPTELDVQGPTADSGFDTYGEPLEAGEPTVEDYAYSESYGNEIEFEEGAEAGEGFGGEEFLGDEVVGGVDESFRPAPDKKGGPVLVTVAVAVVLGAGAVIGGHYMGYSPFENLPFVEQPTTETASVETPAPRTPTDIAGALAEAETNEPATGETAEPVETVAEVEVETPSDPLVDQLNSEGGFQSAAAEPGFEETTGEEGAFDPVDTVMGWFAEEEGETEGGTDETGFESFGPELVVGGDGEWAASDSAVLDPYAEFVEERSGTADFSEVVPVGSLDPTQTDYTQMDIVWRGEDVPSEMLHAAAKVLTPKVGPVRATTRSGEVFEGRLVAIGKRRVWLAAKLGEYALDGDMISNLERLADSTTIDDGGTGTPTPTGKRVKATAQGGVFYGRVLAVQGEKVILVLDNGGRLTLESPEMELASEGIGIRVKQ